MANINLSRLQRNNQNQIMLHSADVKLTVNHIDFWLDTLLHTQKPFSILVRDEINFKKLTKNFPKLQILYAKTPVDVETVVTAQPNLKVVLFTSNLPRNIHLLRFNHLKHIFIGTKNSDWLSQFNKSYRAYDEFWAGGAFVLERLKEEIEDLRHLKLKIIGKPQIEKISSRGLSNRENTSLVVISEKYIEMVYYAHYINAFKMYIYIDKKDIKENLLNKSIVDKKSKEITVFETKEFIDEFVLNASYIITDIKNLTPYFLVYQLPILVYIEDELDKYKVLPEILQNVL